MTAVCAFLAFPVVCLHISYGSGSPMWASSKGSGELARIRGVMGESRVKARAGHGFEWWQGARPVAKSGESHNWGRSMLPETLRRWAWWQKVRLHSLHVHGWVGDLWPVDSGV